MKKTPHVLVAAGGTGGHMFPASAVAKKLVDQGFRVTFVTDVRGRAFGINAKEYDVVLIDAAHFEGDLLKKVRAAFLNLKGLLKSLKVIWTSKPDVVIGFGGYASFLPVLSAILLRIPTIIHQGDAYLGKTNRILAPYVGHIATAYETVKFLKPEWQRKVVLTGLPVRDAIAALEGKPYPELGAKDPLRILITGGSQGAQIFGEIVPEAVQRLPEALQKRLVISQQCRPEFLKEVRRAYKPSVASVELAHFFDDMEVRYRDAHLIIARSGASSVSEIACAGRPAIFVPYPFAMEDHQILNAEIACNGGGAWMIRQDRFTPEALAVLLEEFLESPQKLAEAGLNMKKLARPHGTDHLVSLIKSMMVLSPAGLAPKGEVI